MKPETISVETFLESLRQELKLLYVQQLEVGDLGNEIGIVVAKLANPKTNTEQEFAHGVNHGFDLVRNGHERNRKHRNSNQSKA